jgi:hypothetical protein
MQVARRDAVFALTGFGLGIVVTIVGSLLLPQLHSTNTSTQTNAITPVPSTFEGTLLIDHARSYLAQSSRGLRSIQTPLIMGYSDATSADLEIHVGNGPAINGQVSSCFSKQTGLAGASSSKVM